jgi:hypothetical protein
MSEVEKLYNHAALCFRLAEGVAGLCLVDELEALGRIFDREALELETLERQLHFENSRSPD